MQDVESLISEHYIQTQDLFKAHYRKILSVAREERQAMSDLRKENEELRAQLGVSSAPTARAWETNSQAEEEAAAKQAVKAKPSVRFSPSLAETETLASELDLLAEKPQISLPGEVDSITRTRSSEVPADSRRSMGVTFSEASSRKHVSIKEPVSVVPRQSLSAEEEREFLDRYSAVFSTAASRFSTAASVRPTAMSVNDDGEVGKTGKALFADAASMKERVRQAILKPEYHVSNFYKTTGISQKIARSSIFDNVTLVVIFLNAIWITIDTDYNSAPVIFKADFIFQFVEHSFFAYFLFEWVVRFSAFAAKRDCLRDAWFVFDSSLVMLMIVDGWVISIVILMTGAFEGPGMGAFPVIRILRLLRLTRMMRMARLLRAAPELMILIKGIAGATRSVGFTLVLLCGIVYIFAIAFRTITEGTHIGGLYFSSVTHAASTLLLDGTLPDLAPMVTEVAGEHFAYGALLIFFILLASLTVMNMLVGVLVEVVCTVSTVEKEQMEATFLKGHMLHLLKAVDEDGDVRISRDEFNKLLEKPKAIKALQEVGVDVVGLAELSDFIYKDCGDLNFADFMEILLQLRGTNTATVKSIVDMRMFMTKELSRVEDNLLDKLHQVIQLDMQTAMRVATRETMAIRNNGGLPLTEVEDHAPGSRPQARVALCE